MSKFEVIRGVEGCCLALDDTRIAGPKPWGGGEVIHVWETGKEYKAVDTQSRWHELFGTPEQAAQTIIGGCGGDCIACLLPTDCPCHDSFCADNADYDALLEWLRG